MSKTILFIDGENFLHKVEDVIKAHSPKSRIADAVNLDFKELFTTALNGLTVSEMRYYGAKLHGHPETANKSKELIQAQRRLINNLNKYGIKFILAGNVRGQTVGNKVIFREKGVDVKIAVDLVSLASDKKVDTAILCSSDSDLQPAITELKNRGIQVVYLGFEENPNKGLAYTCNRTILLRNSEVIQASAR